MRVYAHIFAVQFKNEIAYRFNAGLNALGSVLRVLFAQVVFTALYAHNASIGGMTLTQMLGYVVVSTALAQMELSGGVSGEISSRMREGSFSKYMVLPVNVQGYFLSQSLGASAFYLLVNALAAAVSMLLFGIRLPLSTDAGVLLAAAGMILLGLAFMVQLNFFLGILVLRFEDIGIFLMIKDNFVAFLTGALVPLSLLGPGMETVMRAFPFYYVTYLPAMLITGQRAQEAVRGVALLALFLAGMTALNTCAYERMRVRYDGVGI